MAGGHGGGADHSAHTGGGHATHGHARLSGGHEVHGGGQVTHDAITFAYAHGGNGHSDTHFSFHGASNAHPHAVEVVHLGLGRQGEPITRDQARLVAQEAPCRTFLVHVARHGHVEQLTRFYKLASKFGLIRLDNLLPNVDGLKAEKPKLADWNAWAEPYNDGDMPAGYLPGLTGTTGFYKQIWQLGKVKTVGTRQVLMPNMRCNTYIELAAVVWRYKPISDFETKLVLRVVSLPVWDDYNGTWGYMKQPFEAHQSVAIQLAEEFFAFLKGVPPSDESKVLRAWWLSRLPAPPPPSPHDKDGAWPAPEEEAQLEQSDINAEKGHDSQSREDAGQDIDAPPVVPAPVPVPPPTPADNEADEEGGDDSDDSPSFVAAAVAAPRPAAEPAPQASGADLEGLFPPDLVPSKPVDSGKGKSGKAGEKSSTVVFDLPADGQPQAKLVAGSTGRVEFEVPLD